MEHSSDDPNRSVANVLPPPAGHQQRACRHPHRVSHGWDDLILKCGGGAHNFWAPQGEVQNSRTQACVRSSAHSQVQVLLMQARWSWGWDGTEINV
jgi:hypothetical protein